MSGQGFIPLGIRESTKEVIKRLASDQGVAQHRVVNEAMRRFCHELDRDDLADRIPPEPGFNASSAPDG